MKELSIEEKAKAYDEASKWMEGIYPTLTHEQQMEADAFFPKLEESEDEKIRKELICFLETEIPQCNARDKYIAWLEKKGEQKPAWNNSLATYSVWVGGSEINDYYLTKDEAEKLADKYRKNGYDDVVVEEIEQKPINNQFTPEQANILDKHIDKFVEQKPAWSEEDETNLRRTEYAVMKFFGGDCSLVGWLRKSLKERCTWKPSDEQMKWFRDILDYHQFSTKGQKIMQSLYDDLKKLIEE